MNEIKDELIHVFKGEMDRTGQLTHAQYNFLAEFVLCNNYLLQELENVVLSSSKPRLEAGETIKKLEHKVNVLQGDKAELLDLYNGEKEENKRLHERNKRLSEANKDLLKGMNLAVSGSKCDHVNVLVNEWDIKVESLVKFTKHKGTYELVCTECGKKF